MEEDGDWDLEDVEALNDIDLNSDSELEKTKQYIDITQVGFIYCLS